MLHMKACWNPEGGHEGRRRLHANTYYIDCATCEFFFGWNRYWLKIHWMKMSLDEKFIRRNCCWMKVFWMKVSLNEIVFDESVIWWNRFWMKMYSTLWLPSSPHPWALLRRRLCPVAASSAHFLLPSNNDIHSPLAKSANLSSNFFLLINPPRVGPWMSNRGRNMNNFHPRSWWTASSNRLLFQRHAHRITELAFDACITTARRENSRTKFTSSNALKPSRIAACTTLGIATFSSTTSNSSTIIHVWIQHDWGVNLINKLGITAVHWNGPETTWIPHCRI